MAELSDLTTIAGASFPVWPPRHSAVPCRFSGATAQSLRVIAGTNWEHLREHVWGAPSQRPGPKSRRGASGDIEADVSAWGVCIEGIADSQPGLPNDRFGSKAAVVRHRPSIARPSYRACTVSQRLRHLSLTEPVEKCNQKLRDKAFQGALGDVELCGGYADRRHRRGTTLALAIAAMAA
jgi:hypothetical protein